jgi:hypothetical protein
VSLVTLPDDKGIHRPATRRRRVQHRQRHRVGAEGKPTHGIELEVIDEVEHHATNKRCTGMVQRQAT